MTNYQPMSVLPCFSKMLEKIMYSGLDKYLTENSLLYCKQFRFQKRQSPEHAILQLVEGVNQCYEKNKSTLSMFIHLFKPFNIIDQQILLKKLLYYGITGNHLRYFESYLKNPEKFISFEYSSTNNAAVACGISNIL